MDNLLEQIRSNLTIQLDKRESKASGIIIPGKFDFLLVGALPVLATMNSGEKKPVVLSAVKQVDPTHPEFRKVKRCFATSKSLPAYYRDAINDIAKELESAITKARKEQRIDGRSIQSLQVVSINQNAG